MFIVIIFFLLACVHHNQFWLSIANIKRITVPKREVQRVYSMNEDDIAMNSKKVPQYDKNADLWHSLKAKNEIKKKRNH